MCACVCAHVLTKVGDVVSMTTAICFQSWLLLDSPNVFFFQTWTSSYRACARRANEACQLRGVARI